MRLGRCFMRFYDAGRQASRGTIGRQRPGYHRTRPDNRIFPYFQRLNYRGVGTNVDAFIQFHVAGQVYGVHQRTEISNFHVVRQGRSRAYQYVPAQLNVGSNNHILHDHATFTKLTMLKLAQLDRWMKKYRKFNIEIIYLFKNFPFEFTATNSNYEI